MSVEKDMKLKVQIDNVDEELEKVKTFAELLRNAKSLADELASIEFEINIIRDRDKEDKISKEKLEWLEEIGAKKFDKPMLYILGNNWFYSEEYIVNTPLEKLKTKYDERLIKKSEVFTDDEELEKISEEKLKLLEYINAMDIGEFDYFIYPSIYLTKKELIHQSIDELVEMYLNSFKHKMEYRKLRKDELGNHIHLSPKDKIQLFYQWLQEV